VRLDSWYDLAMGRGKRIKKELLALIFFALPAPAIPAPTLLGDWQTPTHSIVRLEPCGDAVCLRLVQLAADAPTRVDQNNPDVALRSRKLCGMVLGIGFHADDATHLSGGHLYDPRTGHTYHGAIALNGNALQLRGYIGIALFDRSESWLRSNAAAVCK
jgi:uncharacterized protein (DUF2147 family)